MSNALEGLNPDQINTVKHTEGNVLVLAGAGSGKALTNSSIVKTPHGDKLMGEIAVGDEVLNSYGSVSKVIGVYPQGNKEIWEVEFSDGVIIECSKDHLWNYQTAKERTSGKGYKTATLEEISKLPIKTPGGGHERWNIYIPMTEPVEYSEKSHYLSPYLLGALIGDGELTNGSYVFSNSEDDVLSRVNQLLSEINYTLIHRANSDYGLSMINQEKASKLRLALTDMNLDGKYSHEKFIPSDYLFSSIEQRVELLKGLIDTNGECTSSNYYYSTTSEQLSKDIVELSRSLGFTASFSKRQTYYTYNGENLPGKPSYRVSIKTSDIIPKIHSSKKHESSWKRGQSSARRTIRRITPTGKDSDMTCIKVDAEDELFLTEGFVVTHNTKSLTGRIAYIIEQGIPPWQILAVTFTNKASKEMRERLINLVGPEGRDVWMGTFHSICIRILIRFGSEIGLDKFTLIDDTDQKKILEEVMNEVGGDFDIPIVINTISNAKNDLLTPEELLNQSTKPHEEMMSHIYMAYEQKKQVAGYIDYDDCIMKTVQLLDRSQQARDVYQHQFRYVLTDEVQDTNHAQFQLLRRLSAHHGNLFAVGDVDQGIYSFRGAKLSNIINFQKYFPDTTIYRLEQNYRSTQTIVNASNALIKLNKERFDKTSFGMKDAGWPIILKKNDDNAKEGEFVADMIRAIKHKGRNYEEMAVLYRTNMQSRMIEAAFLKSGIPYQMVGGSAFNNRKEIKDIVGYLRAAANEMDELAFNRIINVPKRGIGDTTVGRIKDYAIECEVPFSKALENIDDVPKVSKRAKVGIEEFSKMIDRFKAHSESDEGTVAELIKMIVRETGYIDSLDTEKEEDASRVDNIKELINMAAAWDEESDDDATLSQFLTETSLSSDLDTMEDDAGVTLMTIHSSKGLEFPFVFIVGVEEGIFPHGRSLGSESDVEEERRLFYVAMTRAEERLFITHCQQRFDYSRNGPINPKPSRFLSELPKEFVRRV